MIVRMLPLGLAAAAVAWTWVNGEERQALNDLTLTTGGEPRVP
ncbi:hypothetical protein ACF1B0_23905 [Streptomyces anandii]